MKVYAIGAVPRIFGELRKEGTVLDRGQVAIIDLETGSYETILDYKSEEYSAQPGFRSGSLAANGDLILVTGNEIVRFCVKERIVKRKISCQYFNDLHHVVEANDMYYVVSTGFDAILQLDMEGVLCNIFSASFKNPFEKYDEDSDLRQFDSLKPHETHVNHVRVDGEKIWATRFNSRDCKDLMDVESGFELPGEGCHDGVHIEGKIYFTSVDGKIKIVDEKNSYALTEIDLYGATREGVEPLGWCRGIEYKNHVAYVGFTQLRTTKLTSNIRWVRNMIKSRKIEKRPSPTSIVSYSFQSEKVINKYEFPEGGIGALFSIIAVE